MHENKNFLLVFTGFNSDNFLRTRNPREWYIISFSDLIRKPLKDILIIIRKYTYFEFVFGTKNIKEPRFSYPVLFFSLFSKAKSKYFYDNTNYVYRIHYTYYFKRFYFLFIHIFFTIGILLFTYVIIGILFFLKNIPNKYILIKKKRETKTIAFLRTDHFGEPTIGGSFTHFEGVRCGFEKCGYTMSVHAHKKPGNFVEQKTTFHKIRIIPFFDFFEVGEIFYSYYFVYRVTLTLWKNKPDFFYHRHSIFNFSGTLLRYFLRIPLILEYNGSEPWAREKWGGILYLKNLATYMEHAELAAADKISVVSEVLRDELKCKGFDQNKIIVNPNAVNSDNFIIQENASKELKNKISVNNKIIICFLGTFGVWHGADLLAETISIVIKEIPNALFLFIGEGNTKQKVHKIVTKSNTENFVKFLGLIPHEEIPLYLSICDILVNPTLPNNDGSRFFGSPTKLFEYMAAGKAIISSDLEQMGSILENNKTAILVEPGNLESLINAILKLSLDANLRVRLGKKAREVVSQKYTWLINAKNITREYKKIFT